MNLLHLDFETALYKIHAIALRCHHNWVRSFPWTRFLRDLPHQKRSGHSPDAE